MSTASDARRAIIQRLLTATSFLALVVVAGTTGYVALGHGQWSWGDSLYMTIITLSTVGYGEVLPGMHDVPFTRAWTVLLILLGSGTLVYFVSTVTALIVEGDLQGAWRKTRMQRQIDALRDHIVVLGAGTTGIHVIDELVSTQTAFVVVEASVARLAHIEETHAPTRILHVIGDATDDDVLGRAGLDRARGVVICLHDDKDNLYATVTVRSLAPKVRIVAKCVEHHASEKLRRAGADSVVSPSFIGGMRLVSQMLRPSVVEFLDQMLRDKAQNLRIEEATVPEGSRLAGVSLRDAQLRKNTDALVIAVRKPSGELVYNPGPELALAPGMTLIVLARPGDLHSLQRTLMDG